MRFYTLQRKQLHTRCALWRKGKIDIPTFTVKFFHSGSASTQFFRVPVLPRRKLQHFDAAKLSRSKTTTTKAVVSPKKTMWKPSDPGATARWYTSSIFFFSFSLVFRTAFKSLLHTACVSVPSWTVVQKFCLFIASQSPFASLSKALSAAHASSNNCLECLWLFPLAEPRSIRLPMT